MILSFLIRALGKLQKSPNSFIPVHMHLRSQARNQTTIWNLPEELIYYLLKGLHIQDILSMRAVHSYFRDLLDKNASVWASVSFQDSWPSASNIKHFERAANAGNVEALIKLAIAYLYNEGLPGDFEGRKVTSNGEKAADMFCRIENLTPNTDPFTWLFIRPPWSVNGACCKECVFTYMKEYLNKVDDKNIQVCVAKTLMLLDEDSRQEEALEYLRRGANQNYGVAAHLLWQLTQSESVLDPGSELASIRQLRDIANLGYLDAKLALCKYYASGKYGGISLDKAAGFVRDFVLSSVPAHAADGVRSSQEVTSSMRYILVDWLVEVAGMKDFSSQTLHVAVSVVDRFLRNHKITRSKLQLLGVAAMVLCSRFLGKDIITIREAAWLTDNTYKYEDVVRMMGEITATLRGSIKVVTSLDFVEIFSIAASLEPKCCALAEYICELSLLQAEMRQYSSAEIAASSVLLARLLMKSTNPWPHHMQAFSGFSLEDISRCAFHIHEKCFLEGSVVDHREVTLKAVKERYADEKFYNVSSIEIISYKELCLMLGVTEHILQGPDVCVKFRNEDELIMSPSRKKKRTERVTEDLTEREKAATPSIDDNSVLNESVLSGYDGDKEDEDFSFLEYDEDEPMDSSKSDSLLESSMGSESDTYFASLSCASNNSRVMTLNVSFKNASSAFNSGLSFAGNCYTCDNSNGSTSGVSSSPILGKDFNFASTSSASPDNHGQLRSHPGVSTSVDSDTNCSRKPSEDSCLRKCASPAKRMIVKNTSKRKRRKQTASAVKLFSSQ